MNSGPADWTTKAQDEVEKGAEAFFSNMPGFAFTMRWAQDGLLSLPFATRGIEDIFGLRAEEVRKDAAPLRARMHPGDWKRIATTIVQSAQTLQPFQAEFRVRRPGQPESWAECHITPERQIAGQALWHGVVLDITERKAIAKALYDSEHMLQEAQRIAHVGSWDVDLVSDKLVWSDEIFRIWEIDKTKFKADFAAFLETVHPQDRERVGRVYNEAIANRSRYEVEHRLLFPDGRVKHILEQGELQYDAHGEPVHFIGTSLDITERKRMEEQLRMKEYALDHSGDAVFLIDEDARFIYINEQACHSLGYRRAELLTMATPDIDPDYSLEKARAANNEAVARGVITFETRHRRRDGSVFPVEIQLSALEYDGRTLTMAMVRNISERKRLQGVLVESERGFRSLAENIPDNIARWDPEGRYLYINPTHERTLGASLGEMVGQLLPESHQHVRAAVAQVVATGLPLQTEQRVTVDGNLEVHSVSIVPELDANGKIVSVLGMGRDVTVIHRMQETIAARERELRALADSSPGMMGAFYFRPDGLVGMPYASPNIQELFGLTPQDVAEDATPLLKLVHPEDAQRVNDTILESTRDMTPWHQEYRIVHPTKGMRWMEGNTNPQPHPDGGVLWYGHVHDITERKQVLQRMELLDRAIDFSAEAVFLIDEQLRFNYVNAAACRTLGYTREELLALGPGDIDPDTPREVVLAIIKDSPLGVPVTVETRHRAKDGHTYPVEISGVQFEDGGARFGLAIARDISERKLAEAALREGKAVIQSRNDLLQAIVESSPEIIVFALDTNYCYLAFNQKHNEVMRAIWGREAAVGASVLDVIGDHPDRTSAQRAMDRALAGESFVLEEAYGDEARSRQYWRNYWSPIYSEAGKVSGLTCFVLNISERKKTEEALQRSEQLMRSVIDATPDWIFIKDQDHRYQLVNQGYANALGKAPQDIIGKNDLDLGFSAELVMGNPEKGIRGLWAEDRRVMESPEERVYSDDAVTIDGVLHTFHTIKIPLRETSEGSWGVLAVARDITERKQMEETLAAREKEFRTLVEHTPDTIARFDRTYRRTFVNEAAGALFEGGVAALVGKTPTEFPGGAHTQIYEAKLSEVFATGNDVEFELNWDGRGGKEICYHVHLTAESDLTGEIVTVLAVGHDITELNAYRRKIHQLAFYDKLTALPNRALFGDRLQQMLADALRHTHHAALVLLDLDGFKAVNDTFGHPAGDRLLCEAGRRLNRCVRATDTVARLGGDEFAILLPAVRLGHDPGIVAGKILDVFRDPFLVDGKEVFVGASLGIALYPSDSEDADDLLKQADSAMYLAKRSGRNTFRFYSEDLTISAKQRLTTETDLRNCLKRDELELYYQPKYSLADSRLVGSEALLRWNHPQRGMVPPDQFISIAEDSGLIVEIGAWVLREACHTAFEWNKPGQPVHKVAINLSARQFQSGNLVQTVRDVLAQTGCRPEWVELEITESLLLEDGDKVLEELVMFREMGLTIAIDDFGTGYSSLSYLARFPLDTLKIDRSFVSRVVEGGQHAKLVRGIIAIAQSLGQTVVAEGVETADQAAILRDFGCQLVQGYAFGRPMPKSKFVTHGI